MCPAFLKAQDPIVEPTRSECVFKGQTATPEGHRVIKEGKVDLPAPGASFREPTTGLRITRLTSATLAGGQNSKYPYGKYVGTGLTNGYSKYSCANVDESLILAIGTTGFGNGLWGANGEFIGVVNGAKGRAIGEVQSPRWDLSGRPGTRSRLYYVVDRALCAQDVLKGGASQETVFDAGEPIKLDHHSDLSSDARYAPVRLTRRNECRVIDLQEKRFLRTELPVRSLDVSPSGQWAYGERKFWRIADLDAPSTPTVVNLPTDSHGHDGWAWALNGDQLFVYQDNRKDWYCAFNPATGELTKIVHMSEMAGDIQGWSLGQHMGRMPASKPGWLMMSTYCAYEGWAANQLMMIEIKPAEEHPRIWRLGPTYNRRWTAGVDHGYFCESFASIGPTGNALYWGSNWLATHCLELYRMDLPPDWPQSIAP